MSAAVALPHGRLHAAKDSLGRYATRTYTDEGTTRWRIMALLVEALECRQYVRTNDCRPSGICTAEVERVMYEACMVRAGRTAWEPGHGTLAWLLYWTHGITTKQDLRR